MSFLRVSDVGESSITSDNDAIVPSILDERTDSCSVREDIRISGFGKFCKYPVNPERLETAVPA